MTSADPRPLHAIEHTNDRLERAARQQRTSSDTVPGSAWAEQWASHYGAIVRYATHLLSGDIHAAEDVAQETAIRLWQHPEVLDDDQPLGGWLRRVAHNIVVDRARRRHARPTEVALGPGVDIQSPGAFDDIDAEAAVATILSPLSPRHRAVVHQVYALDRPVADVAADLGIAPGTVKSRCHTALHQLRAADLPECA